MLDGIDFGGKTKQEVATYFENKNLLASHSQFIFVQDEKETPVSVQQLHLGYNTDLLAQQAFSIGRSGNNVGDIYIILQAYLNNVNLPSSYTYSQSELVKSLTPIITSVHKEPVDALFEFKEGKAAAFRPSENGQEVDMESINEKINGKIQFITTSSKPRTIKIQIPIKILYPKTTTEEANNLGIKELIGSGTSLFQGSIQTRIYNITLAASRINGVIIRPSETFSFDNALGDVSTFTGYKQAYVIQEGKTVLGDGGGVCQVSTTFFRALLNAGLPIVERHAHAYRVGYYEQDSPPGFDATIYVPTIDLKFKNDTGHHILVQTMLDSNKQRLTVYLYGTKDGRKTTITKPVVTNQTPAPEPLYQDDPSLAKGTTKQIDFAAAGATSTFTRTVEKDGKQIITESFVSHYSPWQAIYLRGTQ